LRDITVENARMKHVAGSKMCFDRKQIFVKVF